LNQRLNKKRNEIGDVSLVFSGEKNEEKTNFKKEKKIFIIQVVFANI